MTKNEGVLVQFEQSLVMPMWKEQRAAYRGRVQHWVRERIDRTSRQLKHPVHDFLFEYYSYRPAYLMRWSPGIGVRLEGATPDDLDWRGSFEKCPGGWVLPASGFPRRRLAFVRWAINYLETTGAREPFFGCFGLHEWAMVYREPERRHRSVPLRLTQSETDALVESAAVSCTHFDAFRFFTPAAVPRNHIPLTRAETAEHDQPGCVHVTMDLYKWAYVLSPYLAAEIVADAFELAVAARELDMRASPYDLRTFGFEAIPIESPAGREQYSAGQKALQEQAAPVRDRVLAAFRKLEEAMRSGDRKLHSSSTMQI